MCGRGRRGDSVDARGRLCDRLGDASSSGLLDDVRGSGGLSEALGVGSGSIWPSMRCSGIATAPPALFGNLIRAAGWLRRCGKGAYDHRTAWARVWTDCGRIDSACGRWRWVSDATGSLRRTRRTLSRSTRSNPSSSRLARAASTASYDGRSPSSAPPRSPNEQEIHALPSAGTSTCQHALSPSPSSSQHALTSALAWTIAHYRESRVC